MYPGLDLEGWREINVPGHWSRTAGFDNCPSVLYRTTYTSETHTPAPDSPTSEPRHWLTLGGIWQGADVWFDGTYLGPTDCWFAPDQFEITKLIRPGSEHIVAIEAHAKRTENGEIQNDLSGLFSARSIVGDTEPGGILSPIKISTTGSVKFSKQQAICVSANNKAATIELSAQIDSSKTQTVFITTTLLPPNAGAPLAMRKPFQLEPGPCEIEWSAAIAEPELWWPHDLGPQPLYRLTVTVECDGKISDIWEKRLGLREVSMSNMQLSVNETPLFVRGVDIWPCEPLPAITDGFHSARKAPRAKCHPSESERDVTDPKADLLLARDLGLNLVRVGSYVASPEVYEAADQLGMLIWQDFPLRGHIGGEALAQGIDSVARIVETLGSYPSVSIWSTHVHPNTYDPDDQIRPIMASRIANSVAGPLLAREFRHYDPSRPVISGSGSSSKALTSLAAGVENGVTKLVQSVGVVWGKAAAGLREILPPKPDGTGSGAGGSETAATDSTRGAIYESGNADNSNPTSPSGDTSSSNTPNRDPRGSDRNGGSGGGSSGSGDTRTNKPGGADTSEVAGRPHIWTEDNVQTQQHQADTHLRLGWDESSYLKLAQYLRRSPHKARWVSNFGSQSIPASLIDRLEPMDLTADIPQELADLYGADLEAFKQYLAADQQQSVTHWAAATQDYQATLLRRQIEMLRRLKYNPTGGFIFSALADCRPAISFAIYDHLRHPKAAVEQVKAACQPVIIVTDTLEPQLEADSPVLFDVHVVNDRKLELTGLRATAELSFDGGSHTWGWVGTVGADSVQRIGSINWITTKRPGPVVLKLTLSRGGAVLATNEYHSAITETAS